MTTTLVLAQLWQVTLVAAVALLLARSCGNRPHLVTALWLVVLVKAVTPPVWSSPVGVFSWWTTPAAEEAVEPDDVVARPSPSESAVVPVEHDTAPTTHLDREVAANVLLGRSGGATPIDPEPLIADSEPIPRPTLPPVEEPPVDPAVTQGPHEEAAATGTSVPSVTTWLVGVWLAGLAFLVLRAIRGWCRVVGALRDRVEPSADLVALFGATRRRLGVRTPVRLVVTRRGLGPAVVGFLRPTVVLPDVVVDRRSAGDLEPILVHELLHVRRGDTWIGALQLLAGAVWWFHPLVVGINRMLSRDVERCCDAESIAALGRSPADYARCLVDVLERKRELRTLPALPGVRPMDVTPTRLERIMRTNSPPTSRTRWASRLLLLGLAAVVLPGASGADEEETRTSEPPATDTVFEYEGGLTVEVPALGPAPLAFDLAVPAEPGMDERTFSFHVGFDRLFAGGFENVRGFRFDPSNTDEPVDPAAPEPDTKPTLEPEDIASPGRRRLIRRFGPLTFELRSTRNYEVRTLTEGPSDHPETLIEVGGAPHVEILLRAGDQDVVRGTCKKAYITQTWENGIARTLVEIDSLELSGAAIGGDASKLRAASAAIRWPVERRADDDVELSMTNVQCDSKLARLQSQRLLLIANSSAETVPEMFGGVALQGSVGLSLPRGDDWFNVSAGKVYIDPKGQLRIESIGGQVSEHSVVERKVEGGEVVTRSNWPIPFVLREPVARHEAAPVSPAFPESPNPADLPNDSTPKPAKRTRHVVVDALLGTAPPPKPPTIEKVLDRWEKLAEVQTPLRVEFVRHRYQYDTKQASSSTGRFSLDLLALKGEDQRFVAFYDLDGSTPSQYRRPGFEHVDDGPTKIVLSRTELQITRQGPDFVGQLTEDQAKVLQSLQLLQVGYLTDIVRENFEWSLVVEETRWRVLGKPTGKAFQEHVAEVEVIVDPVSERPNATRMKLADEAETVHTYPTEPPVLAPGMRQ